MLSFGVEERDLRFEARAWRAGTAMSRLTTWLFAAGTCCASDVIDLEPVVFESGAEG